MEKRQNLSFALITFIFYLKLISYLVIFCICLIHIFQILDGFTSQMITRCCSNSNHYVSIYWMKLTVGKTFSHVSFVLSERNHSTFYSVSLHGTQAEKVLRSDQVRKIEKKTSLQVRDTLGLPYNKIIKNSICLSLYINNGEMRAAPFALCWWYWKLKIQKCQFLNFCSQWRIEKSGRR